MGDKTGIEWTRGEDGTPGATWNPTTGCDRVSPGCDNCYAMTLAPRLQAMEIGRGTRNPKYSKDGNPATSGVGFGVSEHGFALDQPLRWTRPRKIFVNSMSDLFHAEISDEFIARVFAVMAAAPRHTFQVLTKRHARMRALLNDRLWWQHTFPAACRERGVDHTAVGSWADGKATLPNVWMGISVETQQWADIRIPALLDTPAVVRWVSAEPLLGPVDLTRIRPARAGDPNRTDALRPVLDADTGAVLMPGLDWVVVGGESGAKARPMHPQWARDLRDKCDAARVPYLFKQWGEWAPGSAPPGPGLRECMVAADDGTVFEPPHTLWESTSGGDRDRVNRKGWTAMHRTGKHAAGRVLDGTPLDGYPVGCGTGGHKEQVLPAG